MRDSWLQWAMLAGVLFVFLVAVAVAAGTGRRK